MESNPTQYKKKSAENRRNANANTQPRMGPRSVAPATTDSSTSRVLASSNTSLPTQLPARSISSSSISSIKIPLAPLPKAGEDGWMSLIVYPDSNEIKFDDLVRPDFKLRIEEEDKKKSFSFHQSFALTSSIRRVAPGLSGEEDVYDGVIAYLLKFAQVYEAPICYILKLNKWQSQSRFSIGRYLLKPEEIAEVQSHSDFSKGGLLYIHEAVFLRESWERFNEEIGSLREITGGCSEEDTSAIFHNGGNKISFYLMCCYDFYDKQLNIYHPSGVFDYKPEIKRIIDSFSKKVEIIFKGEALSVLNYVKNLLKAYSSNLDSLTPDRRSIVEEVIINEKPLTLTSYENVLLNIMCNKDSNLPNACVYNAYYLWLICKICLSEDENYIKYATKENKTVKEVNETGTYWKQCINFNSIICKMSREVFKNVIEELQPYAQQYMDYEKNLMSPKKEISKKMIIQ